MWVNTYIEAGIPQIARILAEATSPQLRSEQKLSGSLLGLNLFVCTLVWEGILF